MAEDNEKMIPVECDELVSGEWVAKTIYYTPEQIAGLLERVESEERIMAKSVNS